jgi:hypothetical protein
MGTNYYLKKVCPCCGNKDYQHIGKSSFGWRFAFQREPEITTYQEWLGNVQTKLTHDFSLVNEYEDNVHLHDLLDLIATGQRIFPQAPPRYGRIRDENGYEFVEGDFS